MRRLFVVVVLLVAGFVAPQLSDAQPGRRCFDQPGITFCIEGRFREFWEENGGLPVFGYPISGPEREVVAEGNFLAQYFERYRLELHPDKAPPYDVLLGRLGEDRLRQQQRDWKTFPKGQQTADCLWFADSGHSICEPFKSYFENHGILDPAITPAARSLLLFGLPLSEPAMETNAAGATVMTQWFERGRMEYHPNNPPAYRVLLGLLGSEIKSGPPPPAPGMTATPAPPGPTATPVPTPFR